MPKFDKTRNYYADLEVSPNASVDDFKRQFKKLAMLYHPDKNVGKEAEANLKFQTIQSALEILTDPIAKAQYDEARKNHMSRFPRASGVRGNPYQDYGKEFARPPTRRQPATQPQPQPQPQPHSGAQRYRTFAKDVPRTAYSNVREDPQTRKSNADAWERMRSSSTRRAPPPPPPGRAPTSTTRETKPSSSNAVPPRTASQQQKAQASFGNRRTGYVPHSPGLGDEPPVPSTNYFTTRTHSSLFDGVTPDTDYTNVHTADAPTTPTTPPTADPLAQFKAKFWDGRQSTPYQTPGGEKTSLFDDEPAIGRTASTRSPRTPKMPGAFPQARPRSSSTPRSTNNDAQSNFAPKMPSNYTQTPDRYKPKPDQSNAADIPAAFAKTSKPSVPDGSSIPANDGPSVYAKPFVNSSNTPQPRSEQCSTRDKSSHTKSPTSWTANPASRHPYSNYHSPPSEGVKLNPPSGGVGINPSDLSDFEKRMRHDLGSIINSLPSKSKTDDKVAEAKDKAGYTSSQPAKSSANITTTFSFTFENGDNTTDKTPGTEGLARHSADNINTRFVEDELPDGWEFSAGNVAANAPQTPVNLRPQSRARARRQTMRAKQSQAGGVPPVQESSENAARQAFSAGQWNDQIGSQHFVPQASRSASSSPTRRTNAKKPKPVKKTAGTAGLVDEEESEGFLETSRPSSKSGRVSTDSINAMDIDSPPLDKVDSTPKASQTNGARKIPVEPHREEWRAGNLNGVQPKPASSAQNVSSTKGPTIEIEDTSAPRPVPTPTANPFVAQHAGSEDTEEFRMSDFAKVEPFIDPAPKGLKDFSDLKSTLPFESRPSEQIHLERNAVPKSLHLSLPNPPVAPRLPQAIAQVGVRPNLTQFTKYVDDFHQYMDKWASFNSQIMGHFTARETNCRIRRQQRGAAWLDDTADDYLAELEQDKEVDQWWYAARENHQAQIREFKLFKERVK
ncbi:hypothetical protein F4818DRAFT_360438 [Hypoxylon cercidicola]|nr:hypothetical protein F4818DRAFT_360438 [Hypoxylon cercidicola]